MLKNLHVCLLLWEGYLHLAVSSYCMVLYSLKFILYCSSKYNWVIGPLQNEISGFRQIVFKVVTDCVLGVNGRGACIKVALLNHLSKLSLPKDLCASLYSCLFLVQLWQGSPIGMTYTRVL